MQNNLALDGAVSSDPEHFRYTQARSADRAIGKVPMPHSGHIHQPFFPGWWVVSVRGYCLRVTSRDVMALPKMAEDDRNPVQWRTPAGGNLAVAELGSSAALAPYVWLRLSAPAWWGDVGVGS